MTNNDFRKMACKKYVLRIVVPSLLFYLSYLFFSNSIVFIFSNLYKSAVTKSKPTIFIPDGNLTLTDRSTSGLIYKNFTEVFDLDKACDSFKFTDNSTMTSLEHSKIRPLEVTTSEVKIKIETYDLYNRRKTFGYDLITVNAFDDMGLGRVAGRVIDHENGTYTGIINIYWSEVTKINVNLLSSIHHSCLRYNAMKKYGHVMYSQEKAFGTFGFFQTPNGTVRTTCGATPVLHGYKDICNFTAINDDMSFFCGKPEMKSVQCFFIDGTRHGSFVTDFIPESEKILGREQNVAFYDMLTASLEADEKKETKPTCSKRPIRDSWQEAKPTGYRLKDRWQFAHCVSDILHSVLYYRKCLGGKNILVMGDPVTRQYAQFLLTHVLETPNVRVQEFDHGSQEEHSFNRNNITVAYMRHELPMHGQKIDIRTSVLSIPRALEKLSKVKDYGDDLIVIVSYNSQLQPYHPSAFRSRMVKLAAAIKKLKTARPNAMIFFKGPHAYSGNKRSIFFNGHMSIIFEQILFQEFRDIMDMVTYLDTWSISIAHDCQTFHPDPETLDSQIQQFMSYVCFS